MPEDTLSIPEYPLIDSHAHLDAKQFNADRDAVIRRAFHSGIARIIQVGTAPESWEKSLAIASSEKRISVVLGVQPHDSEAFDAEQEAALRERIVSSAGTVVGVGEIGLDFHYDMPVEAQKNAFAAQLALAGELALPVVIHSRESEAETLNILNAEADRRGGGISGVMHCFSGGTAFAERCLALGLDISFSGVVTFKNARDIAEAAAMAPSDRIHVETDSPYLAPVPMRGRRCEPAFVRFTAAHIAAIRNDEFCAFCRMTTENTMRLFGLTP